MFKTSSDPSSTDPARREPATARPAQGDDAPRPDRIERRVRMLDRMAELGMERIERRCSEDRDEAEARRRVGQVTGMILTPAQRESRDAGDVMFQQNSRAVRLCMALADRFETGQTASERKETAERAAAEAQRMARGKEQLGRLVTAAIAHDTEDEVEGDDANDPARRNAAKARADDRDYLTERVFERLTEADIERDLGKLPFSVLVERLCSEMRIEPPWELWEDEDWAQDEARQAVPGSPYVRPVVAEAAAAVRPAGVEETVGRPESPSG